MDVPGRRSFDARANLSQDLPFRLRGRLRLDYFSDITVQQTYNTNIYDASRRQRSFGGSVSGNWGPYSVGGWLDRSQYFFNTTDSTVTGSLPRITFSRGEQPLGTWPVYFGVAGEYSVDGAADDPGVGDLRLGPAAHRRDADRALPVPQVPVLHGELVARLAVHVVERERRSRLAPQVPRRISRNYFDMQARIVGPVFNRIWNTADNGYAEKIKHTVEPWVNLQRVTAIDLGNQVVRLDSTDYIVGGTTRITYGLNNRVYAKRKGGADGGRSREILNVGVRQTYYTNALASVVDPNYSTSFGTVVPQNLSPVSLAARLSPTDSLNATFRTEFNTYVNAFMTLGAAGTYSLGEHGVVSAGWSQRRYITDLSGYDDPARTNHYLNADASLRFRQNRYGGGVSFNYDLKNALLPAEPVRGVLQRAVLRRDGRVPDVQLRRLRLRQRYRPTVQQDRRFSIAITLAGLGSFSPSFGGMGPTAGVPVGRAEARRTERDGESARHRRRRVHRQQLRALRAAGASGLARHDARQADLLRAAREPARRDGQPAAHLRQGRHRRRAVSAPLVRGADIVVHFAAETHVDRSLQSAGEFIHTDVFGTFVLLEAARQATGLRRFIQISTDEVYGSVPTGASKETDELRPRNPYSASKAGADRLAYSYWATYQVPVIVTRASNNYGPYQFPEKVIPLFITNALEDRDCRCTATA